MNHEIVYFPICVKFAENALDLAAPHASKLKILNSIFEFSLNPLHEMFVHFQKRKIGWPACANKGKLCLTFDQEIDIAWTHLVFLSVLLCFTIISIPVFKKLNVFQISEYGIQDTLAENKFFVPRWHLNGVFNVWYVYSFKFIIFSMIEK